MVAAGWPAAVRPRTGACTCCSEQRAGRDKEPGVSRRDNEGEGKHGRARERGEGPHGVLTEELQGMAMGSGKRKGVGDVDGVASGPPAAGHGVQL